MEIKRNRVKETGCLSQKQYLQKVLSKFGNNKSAKPVTMQLGSLFKLSFQLSPRTDKEWEFMIRVSYASAVSSLINEIGYKT